MKSDRRVIKTKKAILNALIELIEEKAFNNISIKDITEKADINRGTFYLHYEDKYDMLRSIEEGIFNDLAKIFKIHLDALKTGKNQLLPDNPNPIVFGILEYIEINHRLFKAILSPKGDSNFTAKLKMHIGNLIDRNEMLEKVSESNDMPLEYIVAYFASAHLGVIQFWIENDMDMPVENIATLLTKMLTFGFTTFGKME